MLMHGPGTGKATPGDTPEDLSGSPGLRDSRQEKGASVVTQVVDFGRALVHTTWMSPDKKLAGFQGKVRPLE